jgi:hypothetical protein
MKSTEGKEGGAEAAAKNCSFRQQRKKQTSF